ncbi:4a-hydroxytetrahydrobiopterin dehydratase [Spongiactinospora gelatinilytica]|uniref:Putative pterin-4-alpha-carbinolamine dehydratase n=1 Tax=Spongiactinospora gelatinilytica TaxID=2666298 RepID=A0A2W2G190_9ACTN|nr:4a-hydroxytetrahydrobiopterin dehydratase [Spongiactinospora gelatinilytica]PZG20644.1 4a-hydroxytetrahydrobiopterin dehydratase [Spongiactinospora gelatinilytica]
MLAESEIVKRLGVLPAWRREGREIRREVTARDFPTAIRIVDAVAVRAEELDHHPDIDIRWRTVTFALTTHSAGGLTESDFGLAADIDRIVKNIESHD